MTRTTTTNITHTTGSKFSLYLRRLEEQRMSITWIRAYECCLIYGGESMMLNVDFGVSSTKNINNSNKIVVVKEQNNWFMLVIRQDNYPKYEMGTDSESGTLNGC